MRNILVGGVIGAMIVSIMSAGGAQSTRADRAANAKDRSRTQSGINIPRASSQFISAVQAGIKYEEERKRIRAVEETIRAKKRLERVLLGIAKEESPLGEGKAAKWARGHCAVRLLASLRPSRKVTQFLVGELKPNKMMMLNGIETLGGNLIQSPLVKVIGCRHGPIEKAIESVPDDEYRERLVDVLVRAVSVKTDDVYSKKGVRIARYIIKIQAERASSDSARSRVKKALKDLREIDKMLKSG